MVAAVRQLPARAARRLGDIRRPSVQECRVELDSHAEQSCVSADCALILRDYDRPVTVYGYDGGRGKTLQIVDAAVSYFDPSTGDTWLLMINQALLVPGLPQPLLCTNQLRMNDIRVNDEPKHRTLNPTQYHHAIAVQIPDSNEVDDEEGKELLIPLQLNGVFSYFPASKPTQQQWNDTPEERCIHLTADAPEWEPSVMGLDELESAMVDVDGSVRERGVGNWSQEHTSRVIAALSQEGITEPPAESLAGALLSQVRVKAKNQKPVKVSAIKTGAKKWKVGPAALAKRWGIGIGAAQRTIECTTQHAVRNMINPTLTRRFAAHDKLLRFRRLPCKMYTDTLEAKVSSWHRMSKYGQVYVTDYGWIGFYPMQSKSDTADTLTQLAHDKGVPTHFVSDNSLEQRQGKFRKKIRSYGSDLRQTDTYSPWQNQAEDGIRELKKSAGRSMAVKKTPIKLWDHCYEWQSKVTSHTVRGHYKLQSEVPETLLTGQTADISPLAEYGWYDWVKYYDHSTHGEGLGRWLGPTHDSVGSAMTSKVLKKNCTVLITATIRPLTQDEWNNPEERKLRHEFDEQVTHRLGQPCNEENIVEVDPDAVTPTYEPYSDDVDGSRGAQPDDGPVPDQATDNITDGPDTPDIHDHYIGATVDVTHRGELRSARVRERARDEDGHLYGTANANPLLDTRSYVVEFPDGDTTEYTANVIAENMIAQCDADGHNIRLMEEIMDHKSDGNAVRDADRYFYNRGRRYPKKTTAGWHLCIQWKGGLTTWERLADMKEAYPVEVAEYAKAVGIQHEPAFAWWTDHVLKKRDRIIAKVTKRYRHITHKFGIEIPQTVKDAYRIDAENKNKVWTTAIEKEMANVRIAFKILDKDAVIPPGYQHMTCHMIFDVKFGEGFRRKARQVASGNQVDTPDHMTYASVVSRETVRIALTMAALMDLEVKASDIQNAYLTAPCAEKIWTTLGPEFGDDAGKKAIIVRALYGLGSSGNAFTAHLAECMKHLGFQPCKADPDLWFKQDHYPDGDKEPYYRYILLYVDDCLSIGVDATATLKKLDQYFQMKPGTIDDPDIYLGNRLKPVILNDGVIAWGMSSSKYVREAIANVERYLQDKMQDKKLKKKATGPWPPGYEAELDTSEELSHECANFYST